MIMHMVQKYWQIIQILHKISENCFNMFQQFWKIMQNYSKLCTMHKTAGTICSIHQIGAFDRINLRLKISNLKFFVEANFKDKSSSSLLKKKRPPQQQKNITWFQSDLERHLDSTIAPIHKALLYRKLILVSQYVGNAFTFTITIYKTWGITGMNFKSNFLTIGKGLEEEKTTNKQATRLFIRVSQDVERATHPANGWRRKSR